MGRKKRNSGMTERWDKDKPKFSPPPPKPKRVPVNGPTVPVKPIPLPSKIGRKYKFDRIDLILAVVFAILCLIAAC